VDRSSLLLSFLLVVGCSPADWQTRAPVPPEGAHFVAAGPGDAYYPLPCAPWGALPINDLRYFRNRAEAETSGYAAARVPDCLGSDESSGDTEGPDSAPGDVRCMIERIIDGDTVVCASGERVRLLLIDTPEMSQGDLGLRAKLALEEMIAVGSAVRLEFDVRDRDHYRRLLAHVHSEEGLWTNMEMVRRGYAVVAVYPPNVRHVEVLRAAADEAREAGRGLWSDAGFDCEPNARRQRRC
jgi:micrococcal nuclease